MSHRPSAAKNAGERVSTRSYLTGRASHGLLQNATLWKDTEQNR